MVLALGWTEDGTMKGQAGSAMRKPPQQPKQDEQQQAASGKVDETNGGEPVKISAKMMLQAETLKGDIRDQFLNFIKARHAAFWEKLTEREQQRFIDEVAMIGGTVVHRALIIIKADTHEYVAVSMGDITLGEEIKFKAATPYTDKSAQTLIKCRLKSVMLVAVSADKYMKERAKAKPDKVGELGLPISAPKTGPGASSDPKAEANLGRGPVDAQGKPLKPDGDGVVDKTKTEQMGEASQKMPGDIGPASPPAAPIGTEAPTHQETR